MHTLLVTGSGGKLTLPVIDSLANSLAVFFFRTLAERGFTQKQLCGELPFLHAVGKEAPASQRCKVHNNMQKEISPGSTSPAPVC